MGLFGLSWMNYKMYQAKQEAVFLFADGAAKPCMSHWVEIVNKANS